MTDRESGVDVYVQVAPVTGPVTPQAGSDAFTIATAKRLEEVGELIRNSCAGMAVGLLEMASAPTEIQMEFGVDVGGEAGVPFVTKGTINANFKVSVTWRPKSPAGS